ncbi:MAG: cobalamin-binding protein [Treponema bryantii]|nr:cobalamin-binding protein [Treponema bryantii]
MNITNCMVHKNKILLFAAIFFSFAFTNCTKKDAQNPNVKAKQSIPQRIVSLSPASTEILFAVGAENQIVAVSDFSDYPPQAQNLPKVGGFDGKTLSLEKILSFNPDFVYLTNVMHNHLIPHFESLNIDYYLSDANSFEQVKNEILQIAKITGHPSNGENLVKEIDSAINKINSQNQLLQKPTVYWEVWNSPFMSVGNSSFINDLINTAGGINIFQEIAQAYPTVSEETIVAKNPQIIIIPQNSGITVDSVKNRKGWSQIDAVKNDKIFIVDDNLLTRSGARIGESAEYLANLFR